MKRNKSKRKIAFHLYRNDTEKFAGPGGPGEVHQFSAYLTSTMHMYSYIYNICVCVCVYTTERYCPRFSFCNLNFSFLISFSSCFALACSSHCLWLYSSILGASEARIYL